MEQDRKQGDLGCLVDIDWEAIESNEKNGESIGKTSTQTKDESWKKGESSLEKINSGVRFVLGCHEFLSKLYDFTHYRAGFESQILHDAFDEFCKVTGEDGTGDLSDHEQGRPEADQCPKEENENVPDGYTQKDSESHGPSHESCKAYLCGHGDLEHLKDEHWCE